MGSGHLDMDSDVVGESSMPRQAPREEEGRRGDLTLSFIGGLGEAWLSRWVEWGVMSLAGYAPRRGHTSEVEQGRGAGTVRGKTFLKLR